MDWTTFGYQISDAMLIPKKTLNLAYRFSTAPQKERPPLLNSASHLNVLWECAKLKIQGKEEGAQCDFGRSRRENTGKKASRDEKGVYVM